MPLARLEHPKDGRADLVLAPSDAMPHRLACWKKPFAIQGVGSDRSVLVIREKVLIFVPGSTSTRCWRLGDLLSAAPLLSQLMREVRRVPSSRLQIQGAAIGGGFGLLCACDFAIGTPNTKWVSPIELGLSPALMTPWLVQKLDLQPPGRSCFVEAPPRARKQLAWDC